MVQRSYVPSRSSYGQMTKRLLAGFCEGEGPGGSDTDGLAGLSASQQYGPFQFGAPFERRCRRVDN